MNHKGHNTKYTHTYSTHTSDMGKLVPKVNVEVILSHTFVFINTISPNFPSPIFLIKIKSCRLHSHSYGKMNGKTQTRHVVGYRGYNSFLMKQLRTMYTSKAL